MDSDTQELPASPDISPEWVIIHDICEGGSVSLHEAHELEFDRALEFTPKIIAIEPTSLAEATRRWITLGNGINHVGMGCGATTVAIFVFCPKSSSCLSWMLPFASANLFCCTLYNISWTTDPCVHYQVDSSEKTRAKLPLNDEVKEALILVRSPDTKRRVLHTTVTLVAISLVVFRVYQWLKRQA